MDDNSIVHAIRFCANHHMEKACAPPRRLRRLVGGKCFGGVPPPKHFCTKPNDAEYNKQISPGWVLFLGPFFFIYILACSPTTEIKKASSTEKNEFKVNFVLKADSIWQAPVQGQQTEVYLVLDLTNLGKYPVRFPIMDKFKVSMRNDEGDELTVDVGQDVLIPGKPITDPVPSGGKHILKLSGQLDRGSNGQLHLTLKDEFGSIWRIGPLKAGSYLLNMDYESRPGEKDNPDLWFGKAEITPVSILII